MECICAKAHKLYTLNIMVYCTMIILQKSYKKKKGDRYYGFLFHFQLVLTSYVSLGK